MQNFSFPETTSFIIDESPINSLRSQSLLLKTTQIIFHKDFDLLRKKFSRKTCNLKFSLNQDKFKLTTILNKLPKLDIYELKISLQPYCPQEDKGKLKSFLKSLENLKKLPNFTKLYLNLSFQNSDVHNFIERLCEGLKRLTRLTHLSLSLWSNDLTEDKITVFMSGLKCLKSLRFFELFLPPTEKLNTRGINELCKSLTSLQKLFGLSLDLSGCLELNDDNIEKLFESIKTLKNLSSLSLSLRSLPELTIKGVYILLSFLNCNQEPDLREDYQIVFSKYLEASPLKLSNLHLDLSASSDRRIPKKKFTTKLSPFNGLTALDLNLSANTNLHAGELMEICFCLGYLKHLSKLSLSLSSNSKVGDEAIICLARAIRPLWLVEFNFKITECGGVGPLSWVFLFQALGASIGMKKLAVRYSFCFGIDHYFLKQLGLCLRRMKSLDFLSLGFLGCSLDDECLGEIAGFLKDARSLQSLQLNLEHNLALTWKGFERIYSELNEMSCLRKFNLSLDSECFSKKQRNLWSWSIEILELQIGGWNEIQFLALCKNLSGLSKLKSLDIRISHGTDISPESIMDFVETIKRIKCLKSSECFGYINTCYGLKNDEKKSFSILWEIKNILAESYVSLWTQYEERLRIFQDMEERSRNRNQNQRWSFTLCGVTLWEW